jgi:hypothetical protein
MVKVHDKRITNFPSLIYVIESVKEEEARFQMNDESLSSETTIYGTRWASRDIPR